MMRTRLLVLVWPLLLFWAGALYAENGVLQAELRPRDCGGVVLYADGKTPVVGFPVRLWNPETKKFVYRTRTDENGAFYIPRLTAGAKKLFVGSIEIDLGVEPEIAGILVQQHAIVVVLPRRALITGRQLMYDVLIAPLVLRPPVTRNIVSP